MRFSQSLFKNTFAARSFHLLSSDYDIHIRKKAKKLSLEYHGLLQVFDQVVSHHLISKEIAIIELTNLYDLNLLNKNNA